MVAIFWKMALPSRDHQKCTVSEIFLKKISKINCWSRQNIQKYEKNNKRVWSENVSFTRYRPLKIQYARGYNESDLLIFGVIFQQEALNMICINELQNVVIYWNDCTRKTVFVTANIKFIAFFNPRLNPRIKM